MQPSVKQIVGDKIRVLASFAERKIQIHFFHWHDRIYKVETTNLFHIEKDGNAKYYHFAVSSQGNDYQIAFNPVTLEWQLKDVVAQS
jgi:hypothetical protein